MILQFFFFILHMVDWASSQNCSAEYQRFSQHHTFCMQPNPNCDVKIRGFPDSKVAIHRLLRAHNTLRNKIAMGKDTDLPSAADMMKLMWDPQLAEVAQKWAESCSLQHDCTECREVENFPVGQIMGMIDYPCTGGVCNGKNNGSVPDYKRFVGMFYDEIKNFDKQNIENFKSFSNNKHSERFSQLMWAKTWRIGCGFVAFQNGVTLRHLLVCNYGPTGNRPKDSVYIPGPPCSKCALNACCDKDCPDTIKRRRFNGLCRMKDKSAAPEYPAQEGLIFNCKFESGSKDCALNVKGGGKTIKKTLLGNILSFRLNGGMQSEVFFDKVIYPSLTPEHKFCVVVLFRKGSAIAGGVDKSKLEIVVVPQSSKPVSFDMGSPKSYASYYMQVPFVKDLKFSLRFSVPEGANEHVLDIMSIISYNGICKQK